MSDIFDGLNPAQAEAVAAPDGPLLIFAGAGSGKTRVLTHRIAHLVQSGRALPQEICALTFTNKAASEMKTRVTTLLGSDPRGMNVSTFHSLGRKILREFPIEAGLNSADFTIYDEDDQKATLRRIIKALNLNLSDGQGDKMSEDKVASIIGGAKDKMLSPAGFLKQAQKSESPYTRRLYFDIAKVYDSYEVELKEANAVDFDDLIKRTVETLYRKPNVLAYYHERMRHLLVDEYQDTSRAQYILTTMLFRKSRNITVVGDDDQCLYSWRGAKVSNILGFREAVPDTRVVVLDHNYRSGKSLLGGAHGVIQNNVERYPKQLWTDRVADQPIRVMRAWDGREEATMVGSEILNLVAHQGKKYSDCAVLYRTHALARPIEDEMLRLRIPYRIVSGTQLFDRAEIKDVLGYMRLLANPRDVSAFARVINTPRRRIGDALRTKILEYSAQHKLPILDAVRDFTQDNMVEKKSRDVVRGFVDVLEPLRESVAGSSVDSLIAEILSRTNYKNTIKDDGKRYDRLESLGSLVTLAARVPETGLAGLTGFLDDIVLASQADNVHENQNAVTMITCHQVKGLEFPAVFVVGCEKGLMPHKMAIEGGRDLEEERRIMYVAMTRAEDRLYLSWAKERFMYGEVLKGGASPYIDEIPPEVRIDYNPGHAIAMGKGIA